MRGLGVHNFRVNPDFRIGDRVKLKKVNPHPLQHLLEILSGEGGVNQGSDWYAKLNLEPYDMISATLAAGNAVGVHDDMISVELYQYQYADSSYIG